METELKSQPWGDAMIDEAFIRRAVEQAEPNALRVALYQITGDPVLLTYELEERKVDRISRQSMITVADKDRPAVREKAFRWLVDHQDELADYQETTPSDEELRRLIREGLGQDPAELRNDLFENLKAIASFDEFPLFLARWTGSRKPEIPKDFKVAIIGAGYSGLAVAIQLDRLGIPFDIYERRPEVGGTWSKNRYPDVRVDGSSTTYQFGFVKKHPWTEYYARGPEVRAYLEGVAKDYGVYDRIRLGHEVTSMEWNEETSRWDIEFQHDGEVVRSSANIVSGATGFFNEPKKLDVKGVDDFKGEIVHTALWPEDPDFTLAGKRVAVIGNGSTGVQLLRSVASEAAHVYPIVRTPQWVQPQVNYGEPVQPEMQWLLQRMPYYWHWDRFMWTAPVPGGEAARDLRVPDPEWKAKGGYFSKANDELRARISDYIRSQLGDREDLIEKLTPKYPPWARRMITDNGWYQTLLQDNVDLVMGAIDHIDADGIVMEDGTQLRVDVIISSTGFDINKYMQPIRIVGRGGETLEERWERDGKGPRAFNSMNVPGFPNLFIQYGPNSQGGGAGGGIIGQIQLWGNYLATLTVHLIEKGYKSFDPKEEVFEEHNRILDERTSKMIWMDPDSRDRNYYVTHGRVLGMNAWTPVEHWEAMVHPNMERDFTIT